MTDTSIRPVTIAEQAQAAAKLAHETHTQQPNPHELGSADWQQWRSAFERWLLCYSAPEADGGA